MGVQFTDWTFNLNAYLRSLREITVQIAVLESNRKYKLYATKPIGKRLQLPSETTTLEANDVNYDFASKTMSFNDAQQACNQFLAHLRLVIDTGQLKPITDDTITSYFRTSLDSQGLLQK